MERVLERKNKQGGLRCIRMVIRAQGWGDAFLSREAGEEQASLQNHSITAGWLGAWGKGKNGVSAS